MDAARLCVLSGNNLKNFPAVSEPPGGIEHDELLVPEKRAFVFVPSVSDRGETCVSS